MISFILFLLFTIANSIGIKYGSYLGVYRISMQISNQTFIYYSKPIDLIKKFTLFHTTPRNGLIVIKNDSLIQDNYMVPVEQISQSFHFDNFSTNLRIYNMKNNHGIGLVPERISLSKDLIVEENKPEPFIIQLIKNKIIKNPIFSFNRLNDNEGILHLGSIPTTILTNKYKAKCRVINVDKWTCQLNGISLKHHNKQIVYKNNDIKKISFQTNHGYLLIPPNLMIFLKRNFFDNFTKNHECNYIIQEGFNSISCGKRVRSDVPILIFNVDGIIFELDLAKYFDGSNENIPMDIPEPLLIYESKSNDEEIILGGLFLRNYSTVFDFNKDTVSFYSEYNFIQDSCYTELIKKRMIVLITILLILNIIFVLICLKLNKLNSL